MENLQNVCKVVLCLLEVNCMQIRTEEQEDQDKKGIALMGLRLGTNKHDYAEPNIPNVDQ